MTEIDKDKLSSDTDSLTDFNQKIIEEFRANGGTVSQFPGGALVLLHSTGARSGQPRLNPLARLDIDGRTLVVGSYLGSDVDPAWVHNLRAHPRARVEIGNGGGTDARDVVARELAREERDALYPRIVAQAPAFADYQAKTDRVIPIFELVRT
ncbi:nitroreductase family deazaflavin-dependent oxidoreductase [Frankia sp. AgPm24]|uniref:nitroreductase family deazaflavin-dependent oxidoreductase n=1 Tax=Frankia sp. AgPm24 TaxID=631128 RepID=UPI00200D67A9|nr:nitroreductase family deazaflavin-dependent oxidoreductase [Frankia sp. AgPm24]MCK9921632.1 nitroreductase family deazaflavin-dependent oxidoreductase [Frankia sp. AgPm24]